MLTQSGCIIHVGLTYLHSAVKIYRNFTEMSVESLGNCLGAYLVRFVDTVVDELNCCYHGVVEGFQLEP